MSVLAGFVLGFVLALVLVALMSCVATNDKGRRGEDTGR